MGISACADYIDFACRVADCRSCLARPGHIWDWNIDRPNWRAYLFHLATSSLDLSKSISLVRRELLLYACKIQETTNGWWRCACRETWQTLKVIAQGRFEGNVQVDEQKRAAQNGQNQAQRKTDEKATLRNRPELNGRTMGAQEPCSFCLHYLHHLFQRVRANLACPCKRVVKYIYQK